MVHSYECTIVPGASELIFRVDDDDVETIDTIGMSYRMVIGPRLQGYRNMGTFFNDMLSIATGDVLLCGNDDMIFETPDWARLILDAANQYPDGLFNFAVRSFNEDHYPFSIVSRKVVNKLGFIWDPRIYWGDIYLRDVMGTLGRCFKLPNVKIEHEWIGHAPDATFLEGKQHEIWERDPGYWEGTHAQAVSEAVEKLRTM